MRHLINENSYMAGVMYAPFCRTRAFSEDEWEKDIIKIKELGFTCIHGFAEWHHIEKQRGVYDFSMLDRILDICEKHSVTAIVNVATANGYGYYSPRWLMDEYDGQGIVNCDGEYAWNGTMYKFPCLDDPWYKDLAKKYIDALAKHYAGDKRVSGWVLWGEPSLYMGGKPICYCKHTVVKFHTWLKEKYKSIDDLNTVWGTDGPSDFADFESVVPPRSANGHQGSYASWHDWSDFMDDNICGTIKEAGDWLKAAGATQPTIVEMFCYFGNYSWATIDPWKLAKTSDIVGCSDFQRPGTENAIMMTIMDSISKHLDKNFFCVEILGGPKQFTNHTTGTFITPSVEELKAEAAQVSGYGAKGYMYWCYRPRFTDREAGEFGMTKADGTPLPRAVETGKLASKLAGNYKKLNNARRKSKVAIFESTWIQRLCNADFVDDIYNRSVRGAMAMCRDLNINADIINCEYILQGKLEEYDTLILPYSYIISEDAIEKIAEFSANGGFVIADYPLGIKNEIGDVYIHAPGGKFSEMFGLTKDDILYIDHEYRIEPNDFEIPLNTFVDYITVNGADVKYKFGDSPLVTSNCYGKGKAVYMAFEFFKLYNDTRNKTLSDKFTELMPNLKPYAYTTTPHKLVSTSCLELENGEKLITVLYEDYGTVDMKYYFDGIVTVSDFLTGEEMPVRYENGRTYIDLTLNTWGFVQLEVAEVL